MSVKLLEAKNVCLQYGFPFHEDLADSRYPEVILQKAHVPTLLFILIRMLLTGRNPIFRMDIIVV